MVVEECLDHLSVHAPLQIPHVQLPLLRVIGWHSLRLLLRLRESNLLLQHRRRPRRGVRAPLVGRRRPAHRRGLRGRRGRGGGISDIPPAFAPASPRGWLPVAGGFGFLRVTGSGGGGGGGGGIGPLTLLLHLLPPPHPAGRGVLFVGLLRSVVVRGGRGGGGGGRGAGGLCHGLGLFGLPLRRRRSRCRGRGGVLPFAAAHVPEKSADA
mmetsp:Transcript_14367/g.27291  ORF Transcript_14367/g.27291 Transcript_14367/m.27291 type:complete len:210 (+) Transcript_14367:485-1114(+)